MVSAFFITCILKFHMLSLQDYLLVFLLGSTGGFLSGFLGVGGGIIYIPILDYILFKMGLRDEALVKAILANSLFTIIFSGAIASYKQYCIKNFYPNEILQTAIPGIITSLVMTYLIRNGEWYSKDTFNYVFAGLLLVISLRMLLSKPEIHSAHVETKNTAYNLTGFFAGIVTAMSGLGGGVVMTPVFTDILKQPIKKASSVSNGVIPLFALFVGIYNLYGTPSLKIHDLQVGFIVFPAVLPLIVSSFIFSPFGVKLSQKASPQFARICFAAIAGVVFLKTLFLIISLH